MDTKFEAALNSLSFFETESFDSFEGDSGITAADSNPVMILDSSYARFLQIWGTTAEELISFKISRTPNVNHDTHDGRGYSYIIQSGGSGADISRSKRK